jgi:hypothetical protein
MTENNVGRIVIHPAFRRMESARDVLRFLQQMGTVKLLYPEQYIIELFNFYALVVCGGYQQMLLTVNFKEVNDDLEFEDIDQLEDSLQLALEFED